MPFYWAVSCQPQLKVSILPALPEHLHPELSTAPARPGRELADQPQGGPAKGAVVSSLHLLQKKHTPPSKARGAARNTP